VLNSVPYYLKVNAQQKRPLGHATSISGSDCPLTWLLRAQGN